MAECHPVGFRWVMKAQASAAPRSSMSIRASRAPARSPTSTCRSAPARDIAFLGGIIRYILENERYFKDYVVNYTNAPAIISDEFRDTEDLRRPVQRLGQEKGSTRPQTWMYEGVDPEAAAGAREAEPGQANRSRSSPFRPSTPTRRCSIRAACSRS